MRPAVVLALLLGACASAQWANDKGERATPEMLAACNQQAWSRTRYEQMAYPTAVPASMFQGNKSGTVFTSTSNPAPFPQQDVQEQGFFNLCMKEKGYDLVPVAAGTR